MQTKLDLVAEPRVLKLEVRASVSLSRMETGLRRQSLVDCVARVCASEKETKEERGRAVQRTWAGRGQTAWLPWMAFPALSSSRLNAAVNERADPGRDVTGSGAVTLTRGREAAGDRALRAPYSLDVCANHERGRRT